MYAAERVRAAVDADQSFRVNAAARSLGASEADSNETLKLMLEEMAARLQASEREIAHLKEASNSQSIGPSSTAIQEDASQSSLSQNPQANLRRLHDLETQLAELQASNSELKANSRRLRDLETHVSLLAHIICVTICF